MSLMNEIKPQGEEYWKNRSVQDTKRDWSENGENWIKDYSLSANHPHRGIILDYIYDIKTNSILEIGCNAGPNLMRITKQFPEIEIAGIDVNQESIEEAKRNLPHAASQLKVGSAANIPFPDNSFDAVLCDAVLMYISPTEIMKSLDEIVRVFKKYVILIEWHSESRLGEIKNYHWARDYETLLQNCDLLTKRIKIPYEMWPSKNWSESGYIWIGVKNK